MSGNEKKKREKIFFFFFEVGTVFGLLPNYIVETKFWVAIQSLYCRDLGLMGIGKCIAIHYIVLQIRNGLQENCIAI